MLNIIIEYSRIVLYKVLACCHTKTTSEFCDKLCFANIILILVNMNNALNWYVCKYW